MSIESFAVVEKRAASARSSTASLSASQTNRHAASSVVSSPLNLLTRSTVAPPTPAEVPNTLAMPSLPKGWNNSPSSVRRASSSALGRVSVTAEAVGVVIVTSPAYIAWPVGLIIRVGIETFAGCSSMKTTERAMSSGLSG